ncbi:hypothetical protein FIBSPDRAFT_898313 [Athelia psychrophila]|uniref:Uncharacterized protein n=1 Tax=Athelia psychrophila TaxID=1759441 RepID=A0A166B6W6_9AGAM|nr:hypothetical protein FIBSPDRAFT_898313 [Fibularhizoctonia sp. CBS 109695]
MYLPTSSIGRTPPLSQYLALSSAPRTRQEIERTSVKAKLENDEVKGQVWIADLSRRVQTCGDRTHIRYLVYLLSDDFTNSISMHLSIVRNKDVYSSHPIADTTSRCVHMQNIVDVVGMESKRQIRLGVGLAELLSVGEGEVVVEVKVPDAKAH